MNVSWLSIIALQAGLALAGMLPQHEIFKPYLGNGWQIWLSQFSTKFWKDFKHTY